MKQNKVGSEVTKANAVSETNQIQEISHHGCGTCIGRSMLSDTQVLVTALITPQPN